MNYTKIYNSLINNAKDRPMINGEYYERHHIIPKSMGGDDSNGNIVSLTAREHYLAHWLLYKIHMNSAMATAWHFMLYHSSGKRYVSHTFALARKAHIKHLTGRKLSAEHRAKISASGMGRRGTESQRDSVVKRNKEVVWTEEMRRKASIAKKGKFLLGNHPRAKKVINIDTQEVFECMTDAALSLGVTKAAIQNSITRDGRCKGFSFRYFK